MGTVPPLSAPPLSPKAPATSSLLPVLPDSANDPNEQ